jgi:putative flavoprotein involved in K+ transport
MTTSVNTVIVGGGQAGLSVSYHLTRLGRDHVVLEQSDRPAEAWRCHRWDSFTLNTPSWQSALPGAPHLGREPDGFMSRDEIVAYLEQYVDRFDLPFRFASRVDRVERHERWGSYLVSIRDGAPIVTRNVVIATGLYQQPKIPALSSGFPSHIRQLHSDAYRNPQQLQPGAVLVVGSGQSGAQIAEELREAGGSVYLAVGRAGRVPRRYRGKDANWWSDRMGLYDRTAEMLPSPQARFAAKPLISGTKGGHTLNLHQFARDGVILLGRLQGVGNGRIMLAPDLHENLARADRHELEFTMAVDQHVASTGMSVPVERLPVLRDGFDLPEIPELDLDAAGITNVIWATSYGFDFSLVKLPILDGDGYPIQKRGVTSYPGLYFAGLPWLHNAKSGLIYGAGEDGAYIAQNIAANNRPGYLEAPRARERAAWQSSSRHG